MKRTGLGARLGAFVAELRRRRVIQVTIAYAIAGWVIVEVASTTFPLLDLPESAARLVLVLLLLGLPLVVAMAWVFDVTPQGVRRTTSPAPAPAFAPRTAPTIRYAQSDGVSIAYYVLGDGPIDLVLVQGWISHLEYAWELPLWADFMGGLASVGRVIVFDKRGTGLSDRTTELPTLEQRMDDVRAVMDAAGSGRAVVFGYSEGGPMAMLFAATYPERTLGLVLYGTYAKREWSPDYPWAPKPEERQKFYDSIRHHWGEGSNDIAWLAPNLVDDEEFTAWWSAYQRRSVSPGAALALAQMNTQVDARHVLPTIRVPTLVMHREKDVDAAVDEARFIAGRIPGARLLVLPGSDHAPWVDSAGIIQHIRDFVRDLEPVDADRVLATILHVEPMASDDFRAAVRREVAHFRGQELAGEQGFQAAFDGPARAVRCAAAIRAHAVRARVPLRAGLHAGECERTNGSLTGLPREIARVAAERSTDQRIIVTSTIRDVVAGSGLTFREAGRMTVAGSPAEWQLYSAEA